MKTYPMLLGAILSLAAISPMAAADVPAKADARAEVVFSHPEKFTDVRDAYSPSDMGRQAILDQIRDYIVRRANDLLPAGQKLTITFTDIDLAGDFEPWRGPEGMDIRIIKDIYPPKMDFEFKLTAADGSVIKEGKRQLRDLDFMSRLSIDHSDPLHFDKALLDDWLRSDLSREKAG